MDKLTILALRIVIALALGVGIIALMALYARWASNT